MWRFPSQLRKLLPDSCITTSAMNCIVVRSGQAMLSAAAAQHAPHNGAVLDHIQHHPGAFTLITAAHHLKEGWKEKRRREGNT